MTLPAAVHQDGLESDVKLILDPVTLHRVSTMPSVLTSLRTTSVSVLLERTGSGVKRVLSDASGTRVRMAELVETLVGT